MNSIPESVRQQLDPGEQVVWSGQPRQGVIVRGSDVFLIPFSFLWCGFAVFWLISVIRAEAPIFFILWGVPFVLIGIYFVIGRFIVEARQRASTSYALTTERVLIVSGFLSKKVKSLNLKTLNDLSLTENGNGYGTVIFGAQNPMGAMFGSFAGWPGMAQFIGPRFDQIENAKVVYELVRKQASR